MKVPHGATNTSKGKTLVPPLELVGFASYNHIVAINHTDSIVHILSVEVESPEGSTSYSLGFDIAPRMSDRHQLVQTDQTLRSLSALGSTWSDHITEAERRYGAKCLRVIHFLPNDNFLLTMRRHYEKQGNVLPTTESTGRLLYRIGDKDRTESQKLKLLAVLMWVDGCTK
jgi:hypothetical protein